MQLISIGPTYSMSRESWIGSLCSLALDIFYSRDSCVDLLEVADVSSSIRAPVHVGEASEAHRNKSHVARQEIKSGCRHAGVQDNQIQVLKMPL
jgi:hypothetical protein